MVARLFWFFVGTILYAYIGYPLVLTLLARSRPAKRLYRPIDPSVTLLITAYNEEAVIGSKLENSLALGYPRDKLQILVAADGSNDSTPDIVRTYASQEVELSYSLPRRGKMAAINRAMSQVRGEIVVFSDANNSFTPNVIQELVAPFADPTVGAVSGAKLIVRGDGALGESEGLYWKYESFIKEQETRLGCCTGVAGEILAIRRDLFESPPDNIINDDFYMAMRLVQRGYRIVYTPKARSSEHISLSAQDEITRRARIVAGRYQALGLAHKLLPLNRPLVVWQIVSHKFLRPLVPLAMIGALLTNLVAVLKPARRQRSRVHLSPPVGTIFLGLQLIFYSLAWLGNRLEAKEGLGKLLYLPTFLVNSNWAALIGLHRFLTRRQTTLWQRARRRDDVQPLATSKQRLLSQPALEGNR